MQAPTTSTSNTITWHQPHRLTTIARDTNVTKRVAYLVAVVFQQDGYDTLHMRRTEQTLDTIVIATGLTYAAAKRMQAQVDEACSHSYAQGHTAARQTYGGRK